MTELSNPPDIHRADRLLRTLSVIALLLLIVAAGAYLRLVGLDWDEGEHLHPDERFLSLVTGAIHSVSSLEEYFDTTRSSLNPNNLGYGFFVYGDFPIILTRYVAEAVGQSYYYTNYLVGRSLAATADLLALVLLFFLGSYVHNKRVGLLAAALYAAAAFPIQQSHFYTVDTFTNLFVVAAFLFAARALTAHRWLDYVFFGLMLGLAMSCKVSVAPLALILVLALGLRVTREIKEWQRSIQAEPPATEETALASPATGLIVRAVVGLALAGLMTLLTFRVGQPYAFLPPSSGEPIDAAELGPVVTLISRVADPIGFRPNPAWLDQMSQVRYYVSGNWDAPPNHQWAHRPILIFPWLNLVRVGMGWPLGLFCWLAFLWALWEIVRRHKGAIRLALPVAWVALFFTWQGIGWVKTMRYFLPIYPFLILLAAWALITLWDRVQALIAVRRAPRWSWPTWVSLGLGTLVLVSAYVWGFAVSRIYTRPVTRVAASRWILEHVPADVTLTFETPAGTRQFQIGLPNNWLPPGPPADDPHQPGVMVTRVEAGQALIAEFKLPFDGRLSGLRLNDVLDPEEQAGLDRLYVAVAADPLGTQVLAEGEVIGDFAADDDLHGDAYTLTFGTPELTANQTYYLVVRSRSGPLVLRGASIATEGQWDDPVPLSLAPYNVWGAMYQGYELNMAWEDGEDKLARLQYILDHADYLTISSNRFYASLPRNPQRYPLSIAYYRALFSGELGFELVGDFTSRPNLGPLEFYDDDAEEAWTVYDHPRVFIFRKTEAYSSERTAEILRSVDLNTIVRAVANKAKGPPVRIPLPGEYPQGQQGAGQTGASAGPDYDPTPRDFYTRAQPLTVVIWWLVIGLIGWLAFPALWVLFPGLPDRGYPFSRVFGLLLGAWLAWLAASAHVIPWSSWGILLALLVVAVFSAVLVVPRWGEFTSWVKSQRRHILLVEGLLVLLYLAFVLIRLGNPDLWHPSFGGEKPMDLSYLNAVLRSTTFPPYDPWFAGGTINYYYFGFVIVGLPIKLLGIRTTLAYNLVLPTLFSMTGLGAFSVAYNLVTPLNANPLPVHQGPRLWEVLRRWPRVSVEELVSVLRSGGQATGAVLAHYPYLAGLAAMLLAVVLGNLDQIRTLLYGLAELGSGTTQWAVYALPNIGDVLRGALIASQGVSLPVSVGEWYWNATRLIPVPIVNGMPTEIGPITEFPFFTFLYADLHAHMIAMPLTLMAMGWCVAQVRGAEQARLPLRLILLNGLVGALVIGALRPTNTWDWPTYLMLGCGALMLAHLQRQGELVLLPALMAGLILAAVLGAGIYLFGSSINTAATPIPSGVLAVGALIGTLIGLAAGFALGLSITRPYSAHNGAPDALRPWGTLLGITAQIAALTGGTMLLFLPYILTYNLRYSSITRWTGSHTPLWAYLDIHGLFLFVVVSWMVCESWHWWQERRQAGRRIDRALILPLIGGLAVYVGLVVLVASRGYEIAIVALPLLLWALVLFFRPDQPLEKRAVLAVLTVTLVLSLAVEIVVLQGDVGRMNTVFKFYLQIWLMLAVVSGAALGWLWPTVRRASGTLQTLWSIALAVLVFLAALYPLLATRAKIADRWVPDAPHSLDGMAYMPYVERYENGVFFSLRPDYEALRWLQDNIQDNPVVLEAHTTEYLWGNRVAVYTGLPAVIGWNWHQRQQRPDQSDEVWQRVLEVDEIYNTPFVSRAQYLIDIYHVDLIIVGDLERAYYNPEGLAKFRELAEQGYLAVIYDRDNTVIYRVMRGQEVNP
jgi:YYY domain-containing protein